MKTFTRLATRFAERFHAFLRPDPTRDWFTLLVTSLILLASVIVWNVWMFDTVSAGGIIGEAATSTPPIFSQASLDAVHAVFADRAAEEAKYAKGIYRYADPSQ
jgi:hypothetical protein